MFNYKSFNPLILHSVYTNTHAVFREKVNGLTPLMVAALEGDEIIVDVLIACVSQ